MAPSSFSRSERQFVFGRERVVAWQRAVLLAGGDLEFRATDVAADTRQLTESCKAFPVDQIEQAKSWSAGLFLALFPLLHRRLAGPEEHRKNSLAHVVGGTYAPYVLGLQLRLRR